MKSGKNLDKKLDDRPVRENERTTAKIHFDQNKKWSHYRESQKPTGAPSGQQGYKNSRANYIKSDYVKAVRELLTRTHLWVITVRSFLQTLFNLIIREIDEIRRIVSLRQMVLKI